MGANDAAMREAWAKVAKCMDEILVRTELDSIIHRKALEAQNLADGVLTEPPRNCDVGTAEEHLGKFERFCRTKKDCGCCPCNVVLKNGQCRYNCFVWAQMPDEEGKEKTR